MYWMQTLYQSTLFRGFDYMDFEKLLPELKGALRNVERGTMLLHEGESASWAGIVISGSLASMKTQIDGSVSILDFIFQSKIFGLDMALTPSRISALSLQSLEDSTVFIFPFHGLETFDWMQINQKLKLTNNMLIYLANENVRKQHKIEITSQYSLRGRILTYLKLMSVRHSSDSFAIPYSREQLANYLCVNRSTLSHELSCMQQEGLIKFRKNKFNLFDKDRD
ncbi:MAG: Crp/Fnr family transcriptional regulator [Bacillota bacterium]